MTTLSMNERWLLAISTAPFFGTLARPMMRGRKMRRASGARNTRESHLSIIASRIDEIVQPPAYGCMHASGGMNSRVGSTLFAEAVGRLDEGAQDARLVEGMPGVRPHHELGLRPRPVKVPGGDRRRADVIASLHDDATDVFQHTGITDELAVIEPAAVHEVVVLDAGKGEREARFGESRDDIWPAKQGDGRRLPGRPGDRRRTVHHWVRIVQQPMVGGNQRTTVRL